MGALEKLQQLLKDYDAVVDSEITFPRYRILPKEVELAMEVIKNHGYLVVFKIVKDPKKVLPKNSSEK